MPFTGAEHRVQLEPQLLTSSLRKQPAAPQSCVPNGHAHLPAVQLLPFPHTPLHSPQLFGSELVSTQALPHNVPDVQRKPQLRPSHVGVPLPDVGPGHVVLHARPQELIDVLLAHVPPQSCVPSGQVQIPNVHC